MTKFNIFNIIATIIIIIVSIVECITGKQPTWFMFFLGWGFCLFYEIEELVR